jgi:hypothetical protein
MLSAHSWQHYAVNRVHLCRVRCVQLLFAFSLTVIQVFCSLGNQRPKSLAALEDHILLAAVKISHGEDLGTTMSCLHDGMEALEDALCGDAQACDWFCLTKPTDCSTFQPSLLPEREESDHSSLSWNAFCNQVTDENEVGLASPPCSPKSFPSAFAMPDCINPRLLQLDHPSIDGGALMAEEVDPLHGGNDDSRGENKVQEEAQGEQGDESEEEQEDEEQENKMKSACLSNLHEIKHLI